VEIVAAVVPKHKRPKANEGISRCRLSQEVAAREWCVRRLPELEANSRLQESRGWARSEEAAQGTLGQFFFCRCRSVTYQRPRVHLVVRYTAGLDYYQALARGAIPLALPKCYSHQAAPALAPDWLPALFTQPLSGSCHYLAQRRPNASKSEDAALEIAAHSRRRIQV